MPAVTAAISSAVAWISATAAAFAAAYPIAFFALKFALTIGLGYVANALSAKPKPSTGIKGTMRAGGTIERSFLVGKYATAGTLVYANTHTNIGDKNVYLVYVIAVSDLPTESLEEVWVNGSRVTYVPGSSSTEPDFGDGIPEFLGSSGGSPADLLFIKYYDGTQSTADSYLVDKFGADPVLPWSSTAIGKGVSYIITTARFAERGQFWAGFPTFKFVLKGAKLYDQRLDSTAGGSGDHRYDDPDTWEWTENPIVMSNHIMRGIQYDGRHFYGLQGTSVNRLPSDSWFAGMNACDTTINDASGDPVAQYRCGAEIPLNVPTVDMIEELGKACNARFAEISGSYKVLVGAAGSSVYSFTDDDILVNYRQTLDQFPGDDSLVNGIAAAYPEPAEGWNMKDAPPRKDDDAIEEDGQELIANIEYHTVPYQDQVQRLQAAALNEARKFIRHQHVLPPSAWVLEPNDVVTWTSTRNGYTSKTFRIEAMDDTDNVDIPVQIVECDPDDYDFNPFPVELWRYITETSDANDYSDPDFDDSSWDEGPPAFGTGSGGGSQGAPPVGTPIAHTNNGQVIWIRRHITSNLQGIGDLHIKIWKDDDARLWWNGVEITLENVTTFTAEATIPAASVLSENDIAAVVETTIPSGIYIAVQITNEPSTDYIPNPTTPPPPSTGTPGTEAAIDGFCSTTEQLTGTETTKFSNPNTVAALWEKGSDVASAGTVSFGEGGFFHVTGTTTITDIDFATDKAGRTAWVIFDGILSLTHSSTLILPTAANITTQAGDRACFVSEGSDTVRCVAYTRADGTALAGSGSGITQLTGDVTAGPGSGSQAATIPNDTVTFAKFQNITDNRLLGRSAGSSGDMQELTVGTGLSLSGGVLTATGGGSGGVGALYPSFTAPVDSDFAWINQGSASVTVNANGGIFISAPANGSDSLRIRKKSAPSTPYTITAAFIPNIVSVNTQLLGLCFRQSSDGKLITVSINANAAGELFISCLDWTNPTTFSATNASVEWDVGGLIFLRITDNGTNRIVSWSTDGYNFKTLLSEARTTFLTANEVGFFANTATASWACEGTLLSWAET